MSNNCSSYLGTTTKKALGLIQSVDSTNVSSKAGNALPAVLVNPFTYSHCTPYLTPEVFNFCYCQDNLQNEAGAVLF